MGFSGQLDDLQQRAARAKSAAQAAATESREQLRECIGGRPAQEQRRPGGGGRMEVRFVSDDGIQQHPVAELERLLDRGHGFV